MRKILFFFFFFSLAFAWAEDEIVIEIHGEPATSSAPTVWQKNAKQLSRALRSTTREQLLYSMPVVSDKDRIVRSSMAEYALVEYYNNGNFRKFLFKAEDPQTFITAAADVADVLAVNKKYGINIGLKLKDFLSFYAQQALQETDPILPPQTTLYKLLYQDINTPAPTERWFLFEKEELTLTFENSQAKEGHLSSLRKQAEEAKPKTTPQPTAQKPPQRTTRKALLSGGTLHDRMYMPRVTNSKFTPPAMLPENNVHRTF